MSQGNAFVTLWYSPRKLRICRLKLSDEIIISLHIKQEIKMLITASGFNAGELTIDDTLDFTEQQLKDMWTEAKEI